uniref:Reverse transcriptase Ty1/copia-type domain-containing protein n=1 Tax=Solanum lycopersicum TaxID=4081 RepID=A0A3Q7HN19_SOLLC
MGHLDRDRQRVYEVAKTNGPRSWKIHYEGAHPRQQANTHMEKRLKDDSFIYMVLYVDDMLIAAKKKYDIQKLKGLLSAEF